MGDVNHDTMSDAERERLLFERFGIAKPSALLTEAEAAAFDRGLKSEARRERLMTSPIRDSLAEGDAARILGDKLQKTLALVGVQKWVKGWTGKAASITRPWLIVAGPTGTGKTIAAGWVIAEVGGRYVRFPDLVQDHRSFSRKGSMREHEIQRAEFRAKYGFTGLLVLDELGIEGESDRDAARDALHELVEMRQRWAHRTLVLTNKMRADLEERFTTGQYDPRTRSRLERLLVTDRDGTPLLAYDIKGADMRRAGSTKVTG